MASCEWYLAAGSKVLLDDLPKSFLCPITCQLLVDPVTAADGHTYERSAIRTWLEDHGTSPMTNMALRNRDLVPNHSLKTAIVEYFEHIDKEKRNR